MIQTTQTNVLSLKTNDLSTNRDFAVFCYQRFLAKKDSCAGFHNKSPYRGLRGRGLTPTKCVKNDHLLM